jgi:hypothetical protein
MENKKKLQAHSPNKFWRKFMNGLLLFLSGFIAGSRIEILMQNKGISPAQCEFVTVGCATPEQIQTKGKK